MDNCKHKNESGSLEKAWKEVKTDTLKISQTHDTAGADFDKLAQEMSSFTEEQKRQSKAMEDAVQKLHSNLKSSYSKFTNQEKTFHQKGETCEELQNSLKFMENTRNTIQTKDIEKLRVKEAKAKDDLEKNENSYKNLHEEVTKSKAAYESEMTKMCELFQTLDEKRIDHTRDNLWKCTNLESRICVEQDEYAEMMRKLIEQCDIDKDIQLYIKYNKTGSEKPPNVAYKPCRGRTIKVQIDPGDSLYSEVMLN